MQPLNGIWRTLIEASIHIVLYHIFLRADTPTMVVDDTHVHVIRLSGLLSLFIMLFKDWNTHFLFALGNERTLVTCKSCEARRVRRSWEARGGRWKWGGGGAGGGEGRTIGGKGREGKRGTFCARAQLQEGRREVREQEGRCLPPCPSLTDVFTCPRVGVGSARKRVLAAHDVGTRQQV